MATVKARLRELGISQAQIARELGCTRQCVNAGLNGATVTRVRDWVCARLGESELDLFGPRKPMGRPRKGKSNPACSARSNTNLLDKGAVQP